MHASTLAPSAALTAQPPRRPLRQPATGLTASRAGALRAAGPAPETKSLPISVFTPVLASASAPAFAPASTSLPTSAPTAASTSAPTFARASELDSMAGSEPALAAAAGSRPVAWAPTHWMWPLPAVAAWALSWAATSLALALGRSTSTALALGLGLSLAAAAAWPGIATWRRSLMLAGYPLAVVASGIASGVPAWIWLMPVALVLVVYPMKAWRDAPIFPTPRRALAGLSAAVPLAVGSRVLDAGSGLGHGLHALHREWPHAQLEGVEHSLALAWAARLRCRGIARVRRDDMWRLRWASYRVVYLFQRPESMARAWAKACAEMAPGSWLVSLDFPVPGVTPARRLLRAGAQPVWLYRVPKAGVRPAPLATDPGDASDLMAEAAIARAAHRTWPESEPGAGYELDVDVAFARALARPERRGG